MFSFELTYLMNSVYLGITWSETSHGLRLSMVYDSEQSFSQQILKIFNQCFNLSNSNSGNYYLDICNGYHVALHGNHYILKKGKTHF